MLTENTKEKEFWDWFIEHKTGLEEFINSGAKDYKLHNELTEALTLYHPDIFPEITINTENQFVLVLSCGGLKDGIPHILRLYDSAPPIPNCIIQKFRQPGFVTELNFNGISVPPKDIKIKTFLNREKIDIEMYIKGYSENDIRYGNLGFLYLDHFIGEYNVMTKIGSIEFKKWRFFTKTSDLISLEGLNNLIKTTFN